MDEIDKKILTYLTEKDIASEAAVINETFKGFEISKEEYVHRLQALQKRDFVRYQRPYGNDAFVQITEKGRYALKSFLKKVLEYLAGHILEILTLIITAVSLILAICSGNFI